MAKDRTGYTYQDSNGRWYARITFTNEQGIRRDIKRSAGDERGGEEGPQIVGARVGRSGRTLA